MGVRYAGQPFAGDFSLGPWWMANVPAAAADNGSPAIGPAGLKNIVLDYDVYLVGATITLENGSTLGTLTVSVFVAEADIGAAYDIAIADSGSNVGTTKRYTTPRRIAAGTAIRVKVSTTADWNGTAGDFNTMLTVRRA